MGPARGPDRRPRSGRRASNRARALITDGLRLAPANPSFLDMRNAILQADLNRGFGDSGRIWAVFAARGMGFLATTTGNRRHRPGPGLLASLRRRTSATAGARQDAARRSGAWGCPAPAQGRAGGRSSRSGSRRPLRSRSLIDRRSRAGRVGRKLPARQALAAPPAALHPPRQGGQPSRCPPQPPAPQRVTFRGRLRSHAPACRALPGVARGHRRRGQPLPHAAPELPRRRPLRRPWRTGSPPPPRARPEHVAIAAGDGLAHLRRARTSGPSARALAARRGRGGRGRPRAGHPSARAGLRRAAARAAAPRRGARARARRPSRRSPRRASRVDGRDAALDASSPDAVHTVIQHLGHHGRAEGRSS